MIKNLPAVQETWVQSLGWEDSLQKEMTTHSRTLAWKIPLDRGAWWATVYRIAKSPIPGILQARLLEWVAISSSNA